LFGAPLEHVETLSVTGRRLLVTSRHSLQQYSTVTGKLVRVVRMPDDMQLCHAVETSSDTFIVGYRTPLWHYGVSNQSINRSNQNCQLLTVSQLSIIALAVTDVTNGQTDRQLAN